MVQIAYTYTAMGYDKDKQKLIGGRVSGEQARLRFSFPAEKISTIHFFGFFFVKDIFITEPKTVSTISSWWC